MTFRSETMVGCANIPPERPPPLPFGEKESRSGD